MSEQLKKEQVEAPVQVQNNWTLSVPETKAWAQELMEHARQNIRPEEPTYLELEPMTLY